MWPACSRRSASRLGKIALFIAIVLFGGRRVVPWLLEQVARTGSRELFTLAVLAIALGMAYGSAALFDVSFALGAFFAGVLLSESELSHQAAADSLPLQDAFAVLLVRARPGLYAMIERGATRLQTLPGIRARTRCAITPSSSASVASAA